MRCALFGTVLDSALYTAHALTTVLAFGILVTRAFSFPRSLCTVRKSCVSSSLLEVRFTVYLNHKS